MEKTRLEELLGALNAGEPIEYDCKSRLEEHLVACINKTGKDGLGDPKCRAEELLQVHAEQMKNGTGGASIINGYAIDVYSADKMDSLLLEQNTGKIYRFVGESDDTYTNGQYYIIEEVE